MPKEKKVALMYEVTLARTAFYICSPCVLHLLDPPQLLKHFLIFTASAHRKSTCQVRGRMSLICLVLCTRTVRLASYVLGKNNTEVKCPCQRSRAGTTATRSLVRDAALDHWVIAMSARFLHCPVTLFTQEKGATESSPHPRKRN